MNSFKFILYITYIISTYKIVFYYISTAEISHFGGRNRKVNKTVKVITQASDIFEMKIISLEILSNIGSYPAIVFFSGLLQKQKARENVTGHEYI